MCHSVEILTFSQVLHRRKLHVPCRVTVCMFFETSNCVSMQWNKRGFILISIYNDSSKLQKLHSTRFALRVPKLEALFCSWSADDGDDHVWSIHPLFGNPLSGFVARSAAERHNATRRHPSLHRPLSLIHSFYWRSVVLLKLSRRPHHFWEASSAKELPPRSESSFVCARLADRCTVLCSLCLIFSQLVGTFSWTWKSGKLCWTRAFFLEFAQQLFSRNRHIVNSTCTHTCTCTAQIRLHIFVLSLHWKLQSKMASLRNLSPK